MHTFEYVRLVNDPLLLLSRGWISFVSSCKGSRKLLFLLAFIHSDPYDSHELNKHPLPVRLSLNAHSIQTSSRESEIQLMFRVLRAPGITQLLTTPTSGATCYFNGSSWQPDIKLVWNFIKRGWLRWRKQIKLWLNLVLWMDFKKQSQIPLSQPGIERVPFAASESMPAPLDQDHTDSTCWTDVLHTESRS